MRNKNSLDWGESIENHDGSFLLDSVFFVGL